MKELLKKYDVPVPRYTSYPTVPYWGEAPTEEQWMHALTSSLTPEEAAWSLYLHIPFCETLCTFCGCNTSITKDHAKGLPYVDALHKEWNYYLQNQPLLAKRPLRHVHLGGGTPTFLVADELTRLLEPMLDQGGWEMGKSEGSIEVDPRRTNKDQLKALRKLGFQRVSLGVQDFNPEVQRLVNRIQPEDITKRISDEARELGYSSVNFDLIYGLPKQTSDSFQHTVETTIKLRPDRIALYSFALVPWIKPAQRLFKDEDLPAGEEKRMLYERAREAFLASGYVEIGMDHFALAEEPLAVAMREGKLHRNFMGYTEIRTDVLLGLGVSAISESRGAFHQNEKVLPLWEQKVNSGKVATHRGHVLTEEDRRQREQILRFMTLGHTPLSEDEQKEAREFLRPMLEDGLVNFDNNELRITEKGKPFLRNAGAFFDLRLRRAQPSARIFSQSI
jgi:oxygen-independent coproporphyrinogen-3 oxidase